MLLTYICACRFGRTSVQAELRPRFPLYGGWKTEFTFGYSLPLSAIMTKAKGQVQLEALFGTPFNHVVVDNLTVKVSALPSAGAHAWHSLGWTSIGARQTQAVTTGLGAML